MYKILVPLDGSRFGEQALATACALARRADAKVKLVHVVDFVSFVEGPAASAEEWLHTNARSDADRYLQDCRTQVLKTWGVQAQATVTEGVPALQIEEEARNWNADLIVMSTHGHGAFDRAWLGSVADSLVRESSTPVILVRASEDQPAASGPETFTHILVALDGSSLAEQALAPVERLARATRARITLVRVVRPWLIATRPLAAAPQLPELREKALAARRDQARDYVTGVASSLDEGLGEVTADVITAESSEAAEIIRYAEQRGVDLIALATRGRSGLKRLVLGSVADKLIRGSPVPVLVASARGEQRKEAAS